MKSRDTIPTDESQFYLGLLCALYSDVVSAIPAHRSVDIRRDMDCIQRRAENEGVAFFTKVLPSLGKAIDKALALGTPLQISGFARRRDSQVPQFLGWLIEQVFHADGSARLDASTDALRMIRQLTLSLYKLELPYSEETKAQVLESFEATDASLVEPVHLTVAERLVMTNAQGLIARVLAQANPLNIVPKHGPGAVATGEKASEKPQFKRLYEGLNRIYSYTEYFYYNLTHVCDRSSSDGGLDNLIPVETSTAKVVLVPKDSRGPRLISMEPLETQWIQQGQMRLLVQTIESHWLTKGRVNFADQSINQSLAIRASAGEIPLCTMDMKDASDRVSEQLVQCLFPSNWVEALEASRSSATTLPSGKTVSLNKFAPMGSAVCFPVEALCFWALAVAYQMQTRSLAESLANTYVYGDDIIVPTKDYVGLSTLYHRLHLRVSPDKCCIGDSFRESCGVDAFKGVNVTPVRFKRRWNHPLMVGSVVSWVEYSNSLWDRGFWKAAEFIRESVVEYWPIPTVSRAGSGSVFKRPTARASDAPFRRKWLRFNPQTHQLEARTLMPVPATIETNPDWECLLDITTRSLSDPSKVREEVPKWSFKLHPGSPRAVAGYYPLPHAVSHKWGWTNVGFANT